MMPLLRTLRSAAGEILYPKVCAGCGYRGTWLCEACEMRVPKLDSRICPRCGAPSKTPCKSCADLDPAIVQARSVYPYTDWIAESIRRFKYGEEFSRAQDLGTRLAPIIQQFGHVDGLVPVPLHASKLRSRGYNQSQLLAEQVAEMLDVPVLSFLRRKRATMSQVSLNQHNRQLNVDGAFELDPAWAPHDDRVYVLIDDVRTSGSTLNACARALSARCSPKILVATFALDLQKAELDAWMRGCLDD